MHRWWDAVLKTMRGGLRPEEKMKASWEMAGRWLYRFDGSRTGTVMQFGVNGEAMTTPRISPTSSRLTACGGTLIALMIAMACTVSGQQAKRPLGSDARRIRLSAAGAAERRRFLKMFARSYFPGRTGQLLIVPREGDFITRPDSDVTFMHGSPWAYDVAIPLMFVGPAVKTGVYSLPAVQQDLAPTLAAALGVAMPPTATAYCRSCGPALLNHALSSLSFWMVCGAITSIGTPMSCRRFPRYAGALRGSVRRTSTFCLRTPPLDTRRSRLAPILVCTESRPTTFTTAYTSGAWTRSPVRCRRY